MELSTLNRSTGRKYAKRVGRGGKRGKTSGRGHKGQGAHASSAPRPQARDMIKKLPKLRGHGKNRAKTVNPNRVSPVVVNVAALDTIFSNGDTVTPQTLLTHKIIEKDGGRLPAVKILGSGDLSKKLSVSGCTVSKTAHEKIEGAGGSVNSEAA